MKIPRQNQVMYSDKDSQNNNINRPTLRIRQELLKPLRNEQNEQNQIKQI